MIYTHYYDYYLLIHVWVFVTCRWGPRVGPAQSAWVVLHWPMHWHWLLPWQWPCSDPAPVCGHCVWGGTCRRAIGRPAGCSLCNSTSNWAWWQRNKNFKFDKRILSFISISERDIWKSALSNEHISKASLWNLGMQNFGNLCIMLGPVGAVGRSTGIRQTFSSSFFTYYDIILYHLHTSQAVLGQTWIWECYLCC